MVANPAQDPSNLIAVVGMAGRFPDAPDTDGLWKLLMDRGDAIHPIPADRWDATAQLDPEREIQGVGGLIEGVDQFDAGFFGISPREAAAIDPQQRLLLEMGWRALEDAGQRVSDLADSRTGVYVGASWHDYELLREEHGARPTPHSLVGNALDVIAARLSYVFKLRGPSMTVETGCSSSLVALHLAGQALRQGEVDSAIVGAANLMLHPHVSVGLTHFGALSPDGRCKTFSSSADGFVRGEGVAALYLKTLRRALEDGDRIHAVVARTVVNNDGGGESLVTPSPEGQEDLLRSAYCDGAVPVGAPTYIEAHGTGTGRGDPIETTAIGRVLGGDRAQNPVLVGSIKSNIGHLEAAAGMAGLFKLLLSLRHGVLPPSLHAEQLNPEIPFDDLNVRVVREPQPLPESGPVYLGVNSFGWGGTNAHVVVTGPPERASLSRDPAGSGRTGLPHLVPVSAKDTSVLARRAAELGSCVPDDADGVPAMAGTLAWRRDHFPERAAVLSATPDELRTGLAALAAADDADSQQEQPGVVRGQARRVGRTAFVFPGQGSQWERMGQELFRESPLFAEVIERCAKALDPHIDWDLVAVFTGEAGDTWMTRIDMLQPALWAMSLGLAELWRAAGVESDVVLGHSQGEITAATLAGILTYEDAALVMARRSAIARRTSGRGRMLAVDLSREAALAALEGFEDSVSLAVHNGPSSCVLSGDEESVLMLRELLEADGTYCRLVNVDYASHSPQMDELHEDLLAALDPAEPRAGSVQLMSTVRREILDGPEMTAAYWVENLRSPVQFADAMTALLDSDVTHVVEISPHPVLAPAIEQLAAAGAEPPVVLTTLRRQHGSPQDVALALARGYVSGLAPFGLLPRNRPVPLPGHPLRPERHWVAEPTRHTGGTRGFEAPLVPAPGAAGTWHSALELSTIDVPWLADHQVHGTPVVPGTAVLAVAVNTARARWGTLPLRLDDVVFRKGVGVGEAPSRLTAEWRDERVDGGVFRLLSLSEGDSSWQVNAEAHAYRWAAEAPLPLFPDWVGSAQSVEVDDFYDEWAERGLEYGTTFRNIRRLHRHGDGSRAVGEVTLPDPLRATNRQHVLHPALWDGALQVSLALCADRGDGAALVPTGIRSLRVLHESDQPVETVWSHAVRLADGTLDIDLFDGARTPLLSLRGLELEPLRAQTADSGDTTRLYHLRWRELAPLDVPDKDIPHGGHGSWAVCTEAYEAGDALVSALSSAGVKATLVPLGDEVAPRDQLGEVPDLEGVVYLAPRGSDGVEAQRLGIGRLTALVRACSERSVLPRVTVVTAGAQAVDHIDVPDPEAALYWGYTRVLRREHGELNPRIVDVATADTRWAQQCAAEVLVDDSEDQIALRESRRLGARLVRGPVPDELLAALPPQHTGTQPFRLSGQSVDGSAQYVPLTRRLPGPGEVELELLTATLDPVDMAPGSGTAEGPHAVHGFAGRVSAVGPGVERSLAGELVVACGLDGPASHVVVRAEHTWPVPEGTDIVDVTALLPTAVAARHGLDRVGRLSEGDTLLIHSAVGPVTDVALRIARARGAHVLVVSVDAAHDEALRTLGAEHVYDARDLSWPQAVRTDTGGLGADVVLCPTAGSELAYALDALAPDGRLIALTGIGAAVGSAAQGTRLNATALSGGASVASLDPVGLLQRRPEQFAEALEEVLRLVSEGLLPTAEVRRLTFQEATSRTPRSEAAAHPHVLFDPATVESVAALPMPGGSFRSDGTYLITGGLGALGLSLARFLAENGAGSLLLVGRSAIQGDTAAQVAALRADGVLVRTARCDVTDLMELGRTLADARRELPPLRGVFHAAGVLSDATVSALTPQQTAEVVRPKVDGARNLQAVTADDPLDCFVLFSSAAGLFGNAGQAAYAAANAALDAFAEARRRRGLPALSVQWGPFSDIGLAAQDSLRGARLEERGMGGFPADEAWPALCRMLRRGEAVTGYVPLALRQWFDAYPDTAACGSWQELRVTVTQDNDRNASATELRARLAAAPMDERIALIEASVRELAARVLRLDQAAVGRESTFKSLGLDSLMSLELRNRLEAAFGLRLSPTLLWAYGAPKGLAKALGEQLSASTESG
ncbi:SDR family NAD(P)-dependent oxidoreductase [Streptomyces sp. NPDC087300]|uniref:type I polyketide synthase n=1 Tax=Streptomyces sp. NPDC087300 TaxID=3365780 RepID=UPI003804A786